jgi:hypothetical protein
VGDRALPLVLAKELRRGHDAGSVLKIVRCRSEIKTRVTEKKEPSHAISLC